MTFKDIIAQRVVDYYAENGPAAKQISHTVAVAGYTALIASKLGLSEREKALHEASAWLHDIGCPDAIRKYGDSLPVHQQDEGERIVDEWFAQADGYPQWSTVQEALSHDEKCWLARVVGTHHQRQQAEELHFEPLFEADLIVNTLEGYYGLSQAQHLYDMLLLTDPGRELYRRMVMDK